MRTKLLVLCCAIIMLSACRRDKSYVNKNFYDVDTIVYEGSAKQPKNIVLMIGDGMGVSELFMGLAANKGNLYIKNCPVLGYNLTGSKNRYVTDSGAAGTAIACGEKTYNGAIGVDKNKKPMKSILKYAEDAGLATGIIASSKITHATPAAFIATVEDRSMDREIASDFLKTDIDLFIGGGKTDFSMGEDGRNLIEELKANEYTFIEDVSALENFESGKLAALIYDDHMPPRKERGNIFPKLGKKAVGLLSEASEKGFFLMIEASQIDWAGHDNDTEYMVGEVLDFDQTVGEVLKFAAADKETLVIVTADHETGGTAIVGGDMSSGKVTTRFISKSHTAVMVPVFAFGPGAEQFGGIYENTEIFHKMKGLLGL